KPQAKAGTLAFFVGGEQADLEKIHPLLMHMGQMVLPLGPAGQGSAYKMLINSLLAQAMAAFSEAVALGEKLGLDRSFLLQNLPKAPVCAPFLATKAGKLLQEDTDTQFPLELMYKDLHLAALSAYEAGLPLPLTATVKEQYAAAVQAGRGREDFSAILNFMADPGK
ncbi:MAG: NAD(P)-dependent oxidoreductase, partial [Bacteroidetes bacterium]